MAETTTFNPLLDLPSEGVLVEGQPYYKEVFEVVKGEIEAMSKEAKIVDLGRLDQLLPREYFRGMISVDKRLASGEITEEGMVKADTILDGCYVPITKGATMRCVDGRTEIGYDDTNPASYELGPQVQGATVDIAVARRLRRGVTAEDTLEKDIEAVIEESNPNDVAPGAHTSDHAPEGELGCGAIAGQEDRLDYYEPAKVVHIGNAVGSVLSLDGKTLADDTFIDLPKNAVELKAYTTSYFNDKPKVLEFLERFNAHAKKVVEGKHNEYKLRLNYERGWTLNTGKMNALTNNQYQVFNLDVGYIIDEFGDDAPFILADAITTVMNLTDGSIRVDARLPRDVTEPIVA